MYACWGKRRKKRNIYRCWLGESPRKESCLSSCWFQLQSLQAGCLLEKQREETGAAEGWKLLRGAARESAGQSERASPAANHGPPSPANLPGSVGGAAVSPGAAGYSSEPLQEAQGRRCVCGEAGGGSAGRPGLGASPVTSTEACIRLVMERPGAHVCIEPPACLYAV